MKTWLLIVFLRLNAALAAEPKVENVLDYYHSQEFVAQALQQIEQSMARLRKDENITPKQSAEVLRLAARIYRGENLMKVFKFAYAKAITLEAMQGLAAWQSSPKGLVIKAAIHDYYTTKPHKRLKPPQLSPNRLNSIKTYLSANKVEDLWLSFIRGADYGVLLALDVYKQPKDRLGREKIKENSWRPNDAYADLAKVGAMNWANEILAPLSNDDIDEMSRFAHTPDGQIAIKAYVRALELMMMRAGETLSAQLESAPRN